MHGQCQTRTFLALAKGLHCVEAPVPPQLPFWGRGVRVKRRGFPQISIVLFFFHWWVPRLPRCRCVSHICSKLYLMLAICQYTRNRSIRGHAARAELGQAAGSNNCPLSRPHSALCVSYTWHVVIHLREPMRWSQLVRSRRGTNIKYHKYYYYGICCTRYPILGANLNLEWGDRRLVAITITRQQGTRGRFAVGG